MNKNIPVIFIHTGNQSYLKTAIKSAQVYHDKVYLVGDKRNSDFIEKWRDIDAYDDSKYLDFERYYIHYSGNSEEFEKMCFKRYFLLYEFMKNENVDQCIMIDSDLLCFTDFTEIDIFDNYDVSLSIPDNQSNYSWTASPHIFYCKKNTLEDFLIFLTETYRDNIQRLKEKYDFHMEYNLQGGVCDMTLLYLWSHNKNVANLYENQEHIYDHAMQVSQGCNTDKILKIKKVRYKNGNMYCYNKDDGSMKIAKTLHFQGSSKAVMDDFFYDHSYVLRIVHRYSEFVRRGLIKLRKRLGVMS